MSRENQNEKQQERKPSNSTTTQKHFFHYLKPFDQEPKPFNHF